MLYIFKISRDRFMKKIAGAMDCNIASMEKEDCLNEINQKISDYNGLVEKYAGLDLEKERYYKGVVAGLDIGLLIVVRNVK